MKQVTCKPTRLDAYKLLHEGSLELARMEANGIKVDEGYLARASEEVKAKIEEGEEALRQDEVWGLWRKEFGAKATLGNLEQLGHVLFTVMGHPCAERTAPTPRYPNGRPKADEAAIEKTGLGFAKDFIRVRKLIKARSTYLEGIRREVTGGYLHPVFNLHLVQTYRSSSDHPNFQNMPIRNPEIGALIRKGFVARPGRRLVEVDFSAIEVRAALWYHKDPVMRAYLTDKSKDMHRDMAAQLYLLRPEQVSKQARYCGKNMYVFPEFYGSYYAECARHLWEATTRMDLRVQGEETTVRAHLERKGIRSLGACDPRKPPVPGTFEHHVQKVEEDFWGRRFKVYGAWKKTWYERYLKAGFIELLTGFLIAGVLRRNEAINYPVQGVAFHCLLWCLIRIGQELRRRRMRALLVGQIHDSGLGDVPDEEVDDFLEICYRVMTEELPRAWPFITCPLEVEAELTPVGGNWHEKKVVAA